MELKFEMDYTLENNFVDIKPLKLNQKNQLFDIAQDKSIWTFFDYDANKKDVFDAYISEALQNRQKQIEYPFAVFDKKTQKYAGMTRIYAYDHYLKNIKIGHSWLGLDWHGKGINKAVKYSILEFLFEKLKMERVGFGVHEQNTKSIYAMRSIKATQEGYFRNYLYKTNDSNERCNLLLYSILKDDWENYLKTYLESKLNLD